MPTRVLVIDDEANIADVLRMGLELEGFAVDVAVTGEEGLKLHEALRPELIVLDLMLPDVDGFEVCSRIRSLGDALILMLTARDAMTDRVRGLDLGADDYLVKPFQFPELLARIRALLRRRPGSAATEAIRVQDLMLHPLTRTVRRGDRPIELTVREFDLLRLMMSRPHRVFDRATLLKLVWGDEFERDSNVVDVFIRRLRDKVDRGGEGPPLIHTVRGVGYVLRG